MKKLNYLLISLFISLCLSSCSDDDGGESFPVTNATVEKIAGEWDLVGLEVNNGKSTIKIQGQNISSTFVQKGINLDYVADFKTNPNLATATGSYTIETTTTSLGQTSTQSLDVNTDDFPTNLQTSEWEIIDGSQIKSSVSGNTSTSKILELTDTTFKYSTDLSQGEVFDADFLGAGGISIEGLDFSVSGELITTLKRIQ